MREHAYEKSGAQSNNVRAPSEALDCAIEELDIDTAEVFIQYYHFFRKWQGDGDSNLFLHRFLGSFRFVFLQNMIPQEDSINAISDILQNQFLIKVLALVLITVLLVVRDTSHDCNCKYVEGPQKCFVLGCVIPHPGCL